MAGYLYSPLELLTPPTQRTDMQDRIKEMAISVGLADVNSCSGQLVTEYGPCESELTAFAQAIARECIDTLKTVKGESSECSDGERRYFEADMYDYVYAIRARFGIAEE